MQSARNLRSGSFRQPSREFSDAQDLGVRGGQAKWVVPRRSVPRGEIGDHHTRSESFRSRAKVRIVGGKTAINEYDVEPQVWSVIGEQLNVLGG